jgi:hypothetical protein
MFSVELDSLALVLGPDAVFPALASYPDPRDAWSDFFHAMGLKTKISAADIVARIDSLTASSATADSRKEMGAVVRNDWGQLPVVAREHDLALHVHQGRQREEVREDHHAGLIDHERIREKPQWLAAIRLLGREFPRHFEERIGIPADHQRTGGSPAFHPLSTGLGGKVDDRSS